MMPLDVTHKVIATRARVDAIRALNTDVGRVAAEWADFFERFDVAKYGSDGGPLHDPTVIAYLIAPHLFTGRFINVEIETQSELTLGMTVADWWGVSNRAPNAMFIRDVHAQGFFDVLTQRLARL
jgi:purine nucleosidase